MQTLSTPAPLQPVATPVRRRGLDTIFVASLWVFLFTCIFDPADKLIGVKIWAFLLCWITGAARVAGHRRGVRIPFGLLAYVAMFVFIPAVSIAGYFMQGRGSPFEGFGMLKGYILITFALLLVLTHTDLFDRMATMLTVLSCVIILTALGIVFVPELYAALYLFGDSSGILSVDRRDYGSDVVLLQVYFVTSPMLAMAIAYYYDLARTAPQHRSRVHFGILAAINILGMVLAGSRNNILIAILLPIALWFLSARSKALACFAGAGLLVLIVLVFQKELGAFFDPEEYSNAVKIQLVQDYLDLFESIPTLLFGQGLGAYHLWSPPKYLAPITELTYFEMIRNFGILGAAVMFWLLLLPMLRLLARGRSSRDKAIAVGYGFYMLMCVSNPNMFSSMGILILSVMLAMTYSARTATRRQPFAAPSM